MSTGSGNQTQHAGLETTRGSREWRRTTRRTDDDPPVLLIRILPDQHRSQPPRRGPVRSRGWPSSAASAAAAGAPRPAGGKHQGGAEPRGASRRLADGRTRLSDERRGVSPPNHRVSRRTGSRAGEKVPVTPQVCGGRGGPGSRRMRSVVSGETRACGRTAAAAAQLVSSPLSPSSSVGSPPHTDSHTHTSSSHSLQGMNNDSC